MEYGWSRLRREEKLLLTLLRGEEGKTAELLAPGSRLDFSFFLDLINYHNLTLPLLNRLLEYNSPQLPENALKACRLMILKQTTMNKLHRKVLIDSARLLSGRGFDVTLMKGLSYDPEERTPRTYGDIDLLIGEDRILEAVRLMEDSGYTYKGSYVLSREEKKDIPGQLEWNNQYQFSCPQSGDTIELHTNLFERDRIRLEDLTALLDHPEIYRRHRLWNDDLHCHIPCPEAALLLLCLHCSLKRALYNNAFILRHISDMEILFSRGIDGDRFLTLCRDSRTVYHTAFSVKLYSIIGEEELPDWYGALYEELTGKERRLLRRHLRCMKNLRESRLLGRLIYNITAPFVIGGKGKRRYTWIRDFLLPTLVQQENRYYRWGFRKESPLIYLTYLINPFQTGWRFIKRLAGLKDR